MQVVVVATGTQRQVLHRAPGPDDAGVWIDWQQTVAGVARVRVWAERYFENTVQALDLARVPAGDVAHRDGVALVGQAGQRRVVCELGLNEHIVPSPQGTPGCLDGFSVHQHLSAEGFSGPALGGWPGGEGVVPLIAGTGLAEDRDRHGQDLDKGRGWCIAGDLLEDWRHREAKCGQDLCQRDLVLQASRLFAGAGQRRTTGGVIGLQFVIVDIVESLPRVGEQVKLAARLGWDTPA